MIATQPHTSAAPSTSAALARASHAPDTQGADTGTTGLESIDLPTEAEMAAALAEFSPGTRTAEANPADAADDSAAETDAEGDESAPADAAPADQGSEGAAATDAEAADAASDSDAAATGEAAHASGTPPTDPSKDSKVSEGVQARFNELTAARRTAEERVAALEQQLASYQARDAGRLEPDVLDTINDTSALERQKQQWGQLNRWAAQNLTAPEAKLGDKVYSTEEVGQIFASTQQLLTEAAPKRAAYLAERAHFDQATAQVYPWAADTKSGDGEFLHRALTQLPQLRSLPNGKLIAADSIIGLKLRNAGITIDDALVARLKAEQARTAKTGAQPASQPARRLPPSAPARPGTVPPRAPAREAQKQAALKRVNRGNASEGDLAASIAAIL